MKNIKKINFKRGILIVSFGTSVLEARKAIDNLYFSAKENFPDFEVRLSFTSNVIRKKLFNENHEFIPNPVQALADFNDDGFSEVNIIPTNIIPGEEYNQIKNVKDSFDLLKGKYGFKNLKIGKPFLNSIEDCKKMAEILCLRFEKYLDKNFYKNSSAVILMGHGSKEPFANSMYLELQKELDKLFPGKFFLGTVEAKPDIYDILNNLNKYKEIKNLILSPFMIVSGEHAKNDLAGIENKNSWLNILKSDGNFNIKTYLAGLGEDYNIVREFLKNIFDATTTH